ncbi:hypothetical protein ABPG74_017288 [Tetrahymena malaccensis]
MKMLKNQDALNLSQSLEDNQNKIEETHKLIQQIEKQLQTLSQQPSIPLTIPTEAFIQNQADQIFQQPLIHLNNQQFEQSSNNPRQNILNQQDSINTDQGQYNQNYYANQPEQVQQDQQASIQLESKQQSAHFQQFSNNNSLRNNQAQLNMNQSREIGKIRNQISPPSRQEKQVTTNGAINQSLMKEIGREYQTQDLKELQREHLQEITLLEQAYRKKILDMEQIIEQQKLQQEKQLMDMQNLLLTLEQKESLISQLKNRQFESYNQQRVFNQYEQQQEMMILAKKLEISEKEKLELISQNENLNRQYKLVLSQNEILSNKYNRILNLYHQLVDNDKEKLIQMQYSECLNKEQSLFLSPSSRTRPTNNNNNINQINNISSIQQYNSTPQVNNNNLKDSNLQIQNELDLLDEIYQQRNAAVFSSLNKKPYQISLSGQKNNLQGQTQQQLFSVEQMYNNNNNQQQVLFSNNQQNNQQVLNNYPYIQQNQNENDMLRISQQNEDIQNQSQRQYSRDYSKNEDASLPIKVFDKKEFVNQKTSNKQLKSPLRENQQENKNIQNKSKNIGGDIKKNISEIKNVLQEDIQTYQNLPTEIQQTSKRETINDFLNLSESVQTKKSTKVKNQSGINASKSSKNNKSGIITNKSFNQSKISQKGKTTKKALK